MDSVNCLCGNVNSCMKTKSYVSADNIIINSFRKTNYIQPFFCKKASCRIRSVSAEHNKRVQLPFLVILFNCLYRKKPGFRTGHRIFKRLFTAGSQNSTAASYDSGNCFRCNRKAVPIYQPTVSVSDSDDFHAIVNHRRTADSANCRIQSRCVSTGSQNTKCFYCCLFHGSYYTRQIYEQARNLNLK